MTQIQPNLRKAALLIRSLDADSATALLAQLSSEEAASVREAIRALGPVDASEQENLLAEIRLAKPSPPDAPHRGVELSLSSATQRSVPAAAEPKSVVEGTKRFQFLEASPAHVLVAYLRREQPQTIAVVLSHLAPQHAAEVLAGLPEPLQGKTIERLEDLGDTDSESVAALESELAAWASSRDARRTLRDGRRDTIASILAAADSKTRAALSNRCKARDTSVRESVEAPPRPVDRPRTVGRANNRGERFPLGNQAVGLPLLSGGHASPAERRPQPAIARRDSVPRLEFDHLIHLDDHALASVLREVDANALALALAASSNELVDRICAQMPKATAKAFRRGLRRIGPVRLSDMEAAQRLVAHHGELHLARRRTKSRAALG